MKRSLLIALCAALAGCAGTKFGQPDKPTAPPAVKPAPVTAPESTASPMAPAILPPATPASALSEGIALYDKGDYNGAIKRLALANVPTAPKATQITALKYTAFSYCLTSRQTLCRQQFEKALKLDPKFDLDAGEKGHPMWGKAWARAKKVKG
jgi:hypothetical protein